MTYTEPPTSQRVDDDIVPQHDVAPVDAEYQLPPGVEPIARSNWQLFRRRFFKHKMAVVSLLILMALIVCCFGAKWIAPYPKNQIDLLTSASPPSAKHWFGTDDLGRDQLTEILYAGQISLRIGLVVAFLSTLAGVIVGALAGWFAGWIDQLLSRLTDLFLIIPEIAVLAIMLKKFGHSPNIIILVLAALGWMYIARVVRGQVLSVKEKEYVEAARASGASNRRIIIRHLLPNCVGPIFVNMTLVIAAAVVTESTLSFLGFGIQPPDNSWGRMLSDAEQYAADFSSFYRIWFPGMMLLLTVLAVNFLGDGLRDAFDTQGH